MDNNDVGEVGEVGEKYVWVIGVIIVILVIIGIIVGLVFILRGGTKKVGESCDNSLQCGDNLICENRTNPALPTNRVCLARSGGKCTNSSDCVAGSNCVNRICS
uniref:Transmembrane protein n=1 Tax=Pithovirus LCPAC403 TaxID=2506596 RepID=A0A481ZBW3_9VIRU|nr:MAG: transmembrane protein [Pithovirus LCPAC403]